MDIKEQGSTTLEAALEEQRHHLLSENKKSPEKTKKTPTQKAIRKSFKMSAHLSNLLPTGTVLTFQILSPVFTQQGNCQTYESKCITLTFVVLSALSCFVVCFTDSVRDKIGKVHHVVATFQGLWVIDGLTNVPPEEAIRYKIKFIDFFHGVLSIIVFVAVVMFDHNVVKCFYPIPSNKVQELLRTVPVAVGVICSLLFVVFPTRRHGIGFPLSRK